MPATFVPFVNAYSCLEIPLQAIGTKFVASREISIMLFLKKRFTGNRKLVFGGLLMVTVIPPTFTESFRPVVLKIIFTPSMTCLVLLIQKRVKKREIAISFYDNLISSEYPRGFQLPRVILGFPRKITRLMNAGLLASLSDDEIKKSVFDMGPTQAPGYDGFTATFFQGFWPIVKKEVCDADEPL
ncbi:hypothetical protein LINPERPRIM_LOCUS38694 [Linum perenne]